MDKIEFTKVLDDFYITYYEKTKDYIKFKFNNVTFWITYFGNNLCIANDNDWDAFDIIENNSDLAEHILQFAFN